MISSSTSWLSWGITLDKTISILSVTSFPLIAFITFLIFCKVLTLLVTSLVHLFVTSFFFFFHVISKVFVCCTLMASNFNWTRSWNFPTIHVFYHGITNDYNIFLGSFIISYFVLIIFKWLLTAFIILLPSSNVSFTSITVSIFVFVRRFL